jgi:arsenate reductase (glutaredoxin)
MTTLYGIPNCDTVKKARAWLAEHDWAVTFHDYKKQGIARDKLSGWVDTVGWEVLLNRQGTTFRKLSEDQRADFDRDKAVALMLAQPSLIKRPVVEHDGRVHVGFSEARWAELFRG